MGVIVMDESPVESFRRWVPTSRFEHINQELLVLEICSDMGPRGAHKGPRGARKGPREAHKGPRGAHKCPRGAHKGTRGAHKGPRGAHKGTRKQDRFRR